MTYDVGNDVAFLIVAHKASCHTLSNAFLKSMNTWQGFYLCCMHLSQRIRQLTICSLVNLPTSKAACSSAIISSACSWSLFKEVFNITSLGWLTGLMDMWAASWQNQQNGMRAQRRLKPAWASAQSDQSSLSAWRKLGFLATNWAQQRLWSAGMLSTQSRWKGSDQEPIQSNPTKWERNTHILDDKNKTTRAERLENSAFPADGHQTILNKITKVKDQQNADEHRQLE